MTDYKIPGKKNLRHFHQTAEISILGKFYALKTKLDAHP